VTIQAVLKTLNTRLESGQGHIPKAWRYTYPQRIHNTAQRCSPWVNLRRFQSWRKQFFGQIGSIDLSKEEIRSKAGDAPEQVASSELCKS
jgi:hypothetical protein